MNRSGRKTGSRPDPLRRTEAMRTSGTAGPDRPFRTKRTDSLYRLSARSRQRR